jgi:UDP-N-acetylglucosamine 2-epimerase
MKKFGTDLDTNATLLPPLSSMGLLNLWKDDTIVLTDGEEMQEEITALGLPCITRENTELRPAVSRRLWQGLAGKNLS